MEMLMAMDMAMAMAMDMAITMAETMTVTLGEHGILNLKSNRKSNLEWLHFLRQDVQIYNFAKSCEKPHKMTMFNGPPTLYFLYFLLARMVHYGSNINVPGFLRFYLWKVASLQHYSVQGDFFNIPPLKSQFLFKIPYFNF